MRKSFLDFNRANAEKNLHSRLNILILILLILIILLISRLYFLQVVSFEHFDTLSETNRIKYIQTPPRRGIIYDRNNMVLADNSSQYSIEINIEEANNIKKIISGIKKEINLTQEEINSFYKKKSKYSHRNSIILKTNLTDSEIAKVLSIRYKFDGLDVTASLMRKYPYKEITSHVLGNVGYIDKSDLSRIDRQNYKSIKYIGKTGIEKTYENILFGVPGYKQVEVNARGRQIRNIDEKPSVPGKDIHLTIDINLQKYMYSKMLGFSGSSIAMNPKNGEVLGMISAPAFDPNNNLWGSFGNYDEIKELNSPMFNRSINGLYSPGSTIKPLVAINAVKNKVIDLETSYFAGPFFQLPTSSRRYRDWKPEGHGEVNLQKAIEQSCDVYFYMLADNLGIKKLSSFFKYFSFGEKTGIDLPYESSGVLPSEDWKLKNIGYKWTDGDTIITGIGQGYFLSTPLQLAYAASIIANKGLIVTPKLNRDIEIEKDKKTLEKENFLTNEIKDELWEAIRQAMFNVVNQENGTAYWTTKNKKNNISGKTGTVQVYSLSQETDEREKENLPKHLKDHSLYIGYAPKEDPQIVVATIVENVGSGSKYAAPISNEIINYYLNKIRERN